MPTDPREALIMAIEEADARHNEVHGISVLDAPVGIARGVQWLAAEVRATRLLLQADTPSTDDITSRALLDAIDRYKRSLEPDAPRTLRTARKALFDMADVLRDEIQ